MAASISANLSQTVAHAVSFLTRPLMEILPASTTTKLQMILEANLIPYYAPTWDVKEPLRGSGRRCLTLTPTCLPPRPIYATCSAINISWSQWITALGGREFDFFVDPGCVSLRLTGIPGSESKIITVWADELPSPAVVTPNPRYPAEFALPKKTLSQQLSEVDAEEDEQLFNMIADHVKAPTWLTPMAETFPISLRSTSPLSSISPHSRCSSRSSTSSSGFSYDTSSSFSQSRQGEYRQTRREKARQSRVFIDTSRNEVTPYDGGKTTVLTGGVMLGGGPKMKVPQQQHQAPVTACNSWRSVRV
ncbi:hypothetical protein AGABI1DRAFT_110109 [Agaricus bisporus var. burnettii JB137-S8]|uniref:Anti-proliferative protein domain-containing protein n=2 Tax=Agaricus bisporus var. burnettii TaxID=192524 RepID=K5XJB3_AGABU|nr:uncharacterized protein AGABI1DRAFT_110109 [Agaricus bisporus var. burnettii JB137-S8]EKM83447.1 hypothetical protein AGABI1DRAFT_110109 [Agaricus bisporus var. burnettii JB137-S8]KAF7784728.1 hypothetical protein Agabi119p4_893 [Agaricus bisporus var. burnettii]